MTRWLTNGVRRPARVRARRLGARPPDHRARRRDRGAHGCAARGDAGRGAQPRASSATSPLPDVGVHPRRRRGRRRRRRRRRRRGHRRHRAGTRAHHRGAQGRQARRHRQQGAARQRRPRAVRDGGGRRASTSCSRRRSPVASRSSARCASRSPATASGGSSASSTARPTTSSAAWPSRARRSHDALAEAQRLGYAERDPTADVEGFDAAAKTAIIASIAFGARVVAGDVYREGISEHHRRRHRVGARARLRGEAARGRRGDRGRRRGAGAPDDDPGRRTRSRRCATRSTRCSSRPTRSVSSCSTAAAPAASPRRARCSAT